MRYPRLIAPFFCYLIIGLILSACSTPNVLYQFSPDAELTTHKERKDPWILGEARLASMKPPGKALDEIATIWPARNILITSIQSSDGTMLYQAPAYNSAIGFLHGRASIGIPWNTMCQLPAETYTISAQYLAISSSGSEMSQSDDYITAEFRKGHKYVISYKIMERKKWSDPDKWRLKILDN